MTCLLHAFAGSSPLEMLENPQEKPNQTWLAWLGDPPEISVSSALVPLSIPVCVGELPTLLVKCSTKMSSNSCGLPGASHNLILSLSIKLPGEVRTSGIEQGLKPLLIDDCRGLEGSILG